MIPTKLATRHLLWYMLCYLLCIPSLLQAQEEQSVLQLLENNAQALDAGYSPALDGSLDLLDHYSTKHNATEHYYFQRQVHGIPVDDAFLHIHKDQNTDQIWAVNSRHLTVESPKTPPISTIDVRRAAEIAIDAVVDKKVELSEGNKGAEKANGVYSWPTDNTGLASLQAQLYYTVSSTGQPILNWLIEVETSAPTYHLWQVFVDAQNGQITKKRDLVLNCTFGPTNGVTADRAAHKHTQACQHHPASNHSMMTGSYRVYDMPIESPNHGSRTLVNDPADSLASPFGWHDDDGATGAEYTITRGNNVLAQDDINGNNGSGWSPDGGAALNFDYSLDFTEAPSTNTTAAQNLSSSLTNLFYWNNLNHDIFYHYGFDEPSGNFQENNYGRGGSGSDFVFADGLDGSGVNNANFGTPSDGSNPRMQMFLWNNTSGNTVFEVTSPSSVSGNYTAAVANFGPSDFSVSGELVLVDDGSASPTEGCNTLTNAGAINGKIAVIDRGSCEFGTKALNAQNAGAIAVVVCNNISGGPIVMGAGANGASVTIPSMMIGQGDCATIRAALPGVLVTMSNTPPQQLDGSFDNAIITHEYGHGISNRLTGGPSTTSCLSNEEQGGEGWSDFFALALTHEAGDTRNTPRGIGTYPLSQPTTGGGIRPYPYTTDMSVNPSTYDDIKTFSVPHGVGSVWCTMLWEVYWDFVDLYGYDPDLYNGSGGNNMAIQLVMDGLKLQPCSPGFADARDAILLADQINHNGAHQCLIWEAFARRGLGVSAQQGSTDNRGDGTEAFDVPSSVELTNFPDITELVEGESYTIEGGAVCGCASVNQVALSHTVGSSFSIDQVSGATVQGNTVTSPTVNLGPGDTLAMSYTISLLPCSVPATDTLFYDDVEGAAQMTSTTLSVSGSWVTSTTVSQSGSTSWYGLDPDITSDYVLTANSPITIDTTSILTFSHQYETEGSWDGGVVELSTDNGNTWIDAGPYMTDNGYPSSLSSLGSGNLAGRPAFTGTSALQFGQSGWINTVIDLSSFAGQSILFRFRFASDDNTTVGGLSGWYIDDIAVMETSRSHINATVTTNATITDTDSLSINLRSPIRTRIFVDQAANGRHNGESWADAFTDLQTAIAAASCDTRPKEIWVAQGTYYPSDNNDRAASFTLVDSVKIYGGFTGAESDLSQRDATANATILSGDIGIVGDSSDNSYHVITSMDNDTTALIDGFTVTAGRADNTLGKGGGFINMGGSARLKDLHFVQNSAVVAGGGTASQSGSPLFSHCTFTDNTTDSDNGRAIAVDSGTVTVKEITISETTSPPTGSSVQVNSSAASLKVSGAVSTIR